MDSTEATHKAPEALVLPTMAEVPHGPDGSPLSDGAAQVTLVPLESEGGRERLAALAFTSVPLLVEAMGEAQPWVIVPTAEIEKALEGSGAQAVLIDPQLADDAAEEPSSG